VFLHGSVSNLLSILRSIAESLENGKAAVMDAPACPSSAAAAKCSRIKILEIILAEILD